MFKLKTIPIQAVPFYLRLSPRTERDGFPAPAMTDGWEAKSPGNETIGSIPTWRLKKELLGAPAMLMGKAKMPASAARAAS